MASVFIQQIPLSSSEEVFLSYFIWFVTAQKIVLLCSLDIAVQRQPALEPTSQFHFYINRTFLQLTQEE